MPVTRLVRPEDADVLAAIVDADRAFLAPWEPVRDDAWFTPDGQRAHLLTILAEHAAGLSLPLAIVDDGGEVVGRVNLMGIRRGALQSAALGYWVRPAAGGRGLATAAVREVVATAFGELGLHRIQAETLVHNVRSQAVLRNNGFVRYGLAPKYLRIAGRWQDHVMFQLLDPAAD